MATEHPPYGPYHRLISTLYVPTEASVPVQVGLLACQSKCVLQKGKPYIHYLYRNPCCGTHLPTLQGLSVFILPQTEPLSRGRARIFFCAGPRLQVYLAQTHDLLTAAAMGYGCAAAQVPERLAFETEGRRKAHKRAEELENDVAAFLAKDLQEEYGRVQNGDARRFTAFCHRIDSSPNPLGSLGAIHSAWCSSPAAWTPFLIVLVSSGVQTSSNHAVVLIFGSDEQEIRDSFKAKGIKGGGKGMKWSGKTENWKGVGGDEWVKAFLEASKTT